MWVFGYGSLMWDGWEAARGCLRREPADLRGYERVFNKASIRNWGSPSRPCPTLNLVQSISGVCRGIAFEFADGQTDQILSYLTEREGKAFALRPLRIRLADGRQPTAFVPVYEGKNILLIDDPSQIAQMISEARGRDGRGVDYVRGLADRLNNIGIDDPAVTAVLSALKLDHVRKAARS